MSILSIFVHRPPLYFAFAGALFVLLFVSRSTSFGAERSHRPLAVAAAAWALGGLWEYLVMTRTPEANIRVDLLVLIPVLWILTAWSVFRWLR